MNGRSMTWQAATRADGAGSAVEVAARPAAAAHFGGARSARRHVPMRVFEKKETSCLFSSAQRPHLVSSSDQLTCLSVRPSDAINTRLSTAS